MKGSGSAINNTSVRVLIAEFTRKNLTTSTPQWYSDGSGGSIGSNLVQNALIGRH